MRTHTATLAGLMIIAVILAACQPAATPTAEPTVAASPTTPPTVKIGVLTVLTGDAGFLGNEQLNAAKVELALFNAETGLNIELVEQDDMLDPDEGKLGAERLVADADVYAVIGPAGSQVCEATQPIFAEAGLAHITPSCTRVSLTDPGTETFFRPIPKDDDQAATDATFMVEDLGATSVVLVDDQSSYGVGLTDGLEAELTALGATVERHSVTQDDTDFSSVVTAVLTADADVVFLASQIANQITLLAVQLREQGYEGIYFTGDGGFDLSWVEPAGDAAEGTYVSTFAPDPHDLSGMSEFVTAFTEEYGEAFGPFAAASALSTRIALEAIQRCLEAGNLSRACARDEIAATNMAESMLGFPVSFGAGNQLEGGHFTIYQVEGGGFKLVQP